MADSRERWVFVIVSPCAGSQRPMLPQPDCGVALAPADSLFPDLLNFILFVINSNQ
jgi:hypothetical protein